MRKKLRIVLRPIHSLQARYALCIGMAFYCRAFSVEAQTNEQIWCEYFLNIPFAKSFNVENAFTYSTLIGKPKWRSMEYCPTVEYSISRFVDVLGAGLVSYTQQYESNNSLEIRAMLGTRFYFTPARRIQTRLLLRLEHRNFQNLETHEWESQLRPRVRVEATFPINQNSYFTNNLWYALVDIERLFVVSDVEERFGNRDRFRIGIGYRLNYSYRFEFIFMNQRSRNGIDEAFTSTDNIFRFRFKHYLRQSKPAKPSGAGG